VHGAVVPGPAGELAASQGPWIDIVSSPLLLGTALSQLSSPYSYDLSPVVAVLGKQPIPLG
jgi:hypothetical protein